MIIKVNNIIIAFKTVHKNSYYVALHQKKFSQLAILSYVKLQLRNFSYV